MLAISQNTTEALASLLGVFLGLAIGLPPVAWAMRRDSEERLGKPKGYFKRHWWQP